MSNQNDEGIMPNPKEEPTESKASESIENSQELKKAYEEAKNKADDNWNQYLRALADMENVRRRAQLDVENARKYGLERFAREMLAVVDSLEHGLQVAESAHDNAYREGMALTLKLCLDNFEKFGIVCINPEGQPFDHNKHEALTTQLNNDVPPNTVLLVAQKGFMLHDRVLRPARVVVSKTESAASQET